MCAAPEKAVAVASNCPTRTSANEHGMTLPSSRATIQRTGRMNRGLRRPAHTMDRGQEISRIASGNTSRRISAAGFPWTTCRDARNSPLGVLTTSSFDRGIPCFSEKLTAARVGWPAISKAIDFGGPVISRVTSSCFSRTFFTIAVSLRGAPKVSIDASTVGSSTKPADDKCFESIALSSCDAFRIIPAGISSQPISEESHREISCGHLGGRSREGLHGGALIEPALRATCVASFRTRPIMAARSVTEIAPRASSRLNRWEHFKHRS